MNLVRDLRLLVQHLEEDAQRIARARGAGSGAGPRLVEVLRGSQRPEPAEIHARIGYAERDSHRAGNVLREAVDRAHRYGAAL